MTITKATRSPYPYRMIDPMSAPAWWSDSQLERHFRGWQDYALEGLYEHLLDNTPADTGIESGVPREWHCLGKNPKCALCVAWINWDDELTAIEREVRRRGVWRS